MTEAKAGRRQEFMAISVVVLLLTLIGAGVGFAVGTLMGDSEATTSASPDEAPPIKKTADSDSDHPSDMTDEASPHASGLTEELPSEELVIAQFPTVLTTLAEPKGKWIRLEGSIMVRKTSERKPELLAQEAGEQILTYLRSVRLSQLDSPSGILGLRDDLDETVRTLSGEDVRGVLIHGLVVE